MHINRKKKRYIEMIKYSFTYLWFVASLWHVYFAVEIFIIHNLWCEYWQFLLHFKLLDFSFYLPFICLPFRMLNYILKDCDKRHLSIHSKYLTMITNNELQIVWQVITFFDHTNLPEILSMVLLNNYVLIHDIFYAFRISMFNFAYINFE